MYGSQIWDYSSNDVERVYTAWRKCIRRVWGLHPRTHCNLLSGISNELYIEQQLHSRFIKWFHCALNSKNNCIRTCAKLALGGSYSTICNSVNQMCHTYGFQKYNLTCTDVVYLLSVVRNSTSDDVSPDAGAIKDFIVWRDDPTTQVQTREDLIDIIEYICTY